MRLTRANNTSVPLTLGKNTAYNLTKGGERVSLIDLENGTGSCTEGDAKINATITGTVPEGAYTGVRMYMGVPFPLNHTDITSAPAPLDLAAMNWSWQSGRKFNKIEVVDPAGAAGTWASKAFFVHLGSTGCTGNPATGATVSCSRSNRMAIRLAKFDPTTQKVAIDLKALLAGNDITVNKAGAPGCMSGATDPECGGVFDAMKIGWLADGTGSGSALNGGSGQTRLPGDVQVSPARAPRPARAGGMRPLRGAPRPRWAACLVAALVLLALTGLRAPGPASAAGGGWSWDLPKGFPTPKVPTSNPMTRAKVELGRRLFYDPRLSGNGRQSCSSCHLQDKAFTDGRARADRLDRRDPPAQRAVAHQRRLQRHARLGEPVAGDSREADGGAPLRRAPGRDGDHRRQQGEVIRRLMRDPRYRTMFAAAFPTQAKPVDADQRDQGDRHPSSAR